MSGAWAGPRRWPGTLSLVGGHTGIGGDHGADGEHDVGGKIEVDDADARVAFDGAILGSDHVTTVAAGRRGRQSAQVYLSPHWGWGCRGTARRLLRWAVRPPAGGGRAR